MSAHASGRSLPQASSPARPENPEDPGSSQEGSSRTARPGGGARPDGPDRRGRDERGDRHDRPGAAAAVGWRLVGANNRELGRSAGTYASLVECQAAVLLLREHIAQVRAQLSMADAGGTWTWRVELGGRDVAVSGRTYHRLRECQQNLGRFLAAVPVAELTEGTAQRPRLRGLRASAPARSTRGEPEEPRDGRARRGTAVQAAPAAPAAPAVQAATAASGVTRIGAVAR
ncbi:hypothetical protein OIE69_25605 [Actinacidiphila glaucinigra]|uniref:hypothetical protein n=1 Tax=Actinacidiphila glaucinigra TaxID=235986 RepID=UPI002DDC6779|nr:hypothetical protein [Actinacidiphila glaucinigra]WSD62027.1 hypothetical protein OIE69_25605 [Actinacidiphila glaucinigra]